MGRGFVLIAVLLVTVAMAAGLTALLSGVRGQSDTVLAVVARQEHRLAARSAAYAMAAELGSLRDRAMAGEPLEPTSTASVIRHEDAAGWVWVIEANEGEELTRAMSAGVDVNGASDDLLKALIPETADAIIAARPIRTPGQLRTLIRPSTDDDAATEVAVTLMSIDPQVRSGAGGPAGSLGSERVGVESGAPMPTGLSLDGATLFAAIADGTWRPSSLGHILREVQSRGIPADDWDQIVDSVVIGDALPRRGLIDVNHATEAVLAALPGMDAGKAAALVERRVQLSSDDRAGLTWPLREGVIDLDTYAGIVDMLTVRSMQIGVRFRVEREQREPVGDAAPEAAEVEPVLVFEGVVDLAGEEPRFVLFRDVSFLAWEAGEQEAPTETGNPEEVNTAQDEVEEASPTPEPSETREEEAAPRLEAGSIGRFVPGRAG